jgi:ribosome-associated heat shock protein Hsp15
MSGTDTIRLDKWLYFARVCKTRALAQKLIDRGQVTLNGAKTRKASGSVRRNDVLVIITGPLKRTLMVKEFGVRRGPAPEARTLYDQPAPPQRLDRDEHGTPLHRPLFTRPKGSGRPTKKDRREIDKFLTKS